MQKEPLTSHAGPPPAALALLEVPPGRVPSTPHLPHTSLQLSRPMSLTAAANEVKNAATKLGYVWQSQGCDSFYWQRLGRKVRPIGS